ncbi:MAG: RHS repeat-associated core domain-containing protein, partial [Planctomycetota bacterium]
FLTGERVIEHEYDANNRVITTTDALDRRTTYTYDAVGQIVESTLPLSNGASNSSRNTFVFDGIGRLRESTDGLSQTTKFGYDGAGNQTSITDPRGDFYTVRSEYDGIGRLVSITEPTGTQSLPGPVATTEFFYEDAGSVVREIDPRGSAFESITYFDIEGQIASIDQADGRSAESLTRLRTDYEFDAAGFVVAERDHRGGIYDTLFQYDAVGNLLRIDSPVGTLETPGRRAQQFTYNEIGKPTEIIGYGGIADVTRYEYDAVGQMTAAIDPLGNRTDWVVDRYGNRQQTSDRFGATTVTYDAGDRATRIIDALGQETQFNYTVVAEMETIVQIDPRSNPHTTQFDVLGRPVVQINPLNQRTTFGYDAAGNPTRVIDANGVLHETEFDARNLPVRESNAVGTEDAISIHFTYDLLGREIRRTDPRDSQGNFYAVETAYDALSRPIRTTRSAATPTNPNAARATSAESNGQLVEEVFYDTAGNVIRIVPEGGDSFAETFTYDLANRPASHTLPTGVEDDERQSTIRYVYDNRDRLVETTDPLGHTTSWEYDLIDRVTRKTIASSERGDLVELYEYADEFGGNRLTVTDATGAVAEVHHYDVLGRVNRIEQRGNPDLIREFDASGNLTLEEQGRWRESYSYDARDYQVGITDAEGNTRVLEYDAVGNLLRDRSPGNINAVEFTYDALNRVSTRTDGVGAVTSYEYDAAGLLTSLTDGEGTATTFEYDATGLVIARTDSLGTENYTYNAAGQRVRSVDRAGRERRFVVGRDGTTRVEQWLNESGDVIHEIQFAIDAAGRLTNAQEGAYTVAFAPHDDASNHLKAQTLTQFDRTIVLDQDVDELGRLASQTAQIDSDSSFASWDYTRNASSQRLTNITLSGPSIDAVDVGLSYYTDLPDSVSQVTRQVTGGPVVTSQFVIDSRGLMTSATHSEPSGVIAEYSATFNANGLVATETDSRGTSTFIYDDANRLVGVERPGALPDEVYELDLVGNPSDADTVVGSTNQIEEDANATYAYDGEGNLVEVVDKETGDRTTYEWDFRNRLVRVSEFSSGGTELARATNEFDAFDRRARQTISQAGQDGLEVVEDRFFIYDGQRLLAEYLVDSSDDVTVDVVYLVNPESATTLAETRGVGQSDFLLRDRIGSTRLIADATDVSASELHYDAYGNLEIADASLASSRFLFTGAEFDAALGLYYMNARYYSPLSGRFLSLDPSGFAGQDVNLYRYAGSDPANFSDPSGLTRISIGGLSDLTHRAASYSQGLPDGFKGRLQPLRFSPGLSFGASAYASALQDASNEVDALVSSAIRKTAPATAFLNRVAGQVFYYSVHGEFAPSEQIAAQSGRELLKHLGEGFRDQTQRYEAMQRNVSRRGQANFTGDGPLSSWGVVGEFLTHHFYVLEGAKNALFQGASDTFAMAADLAEYQLEVHGGGVSDRTNHRYYSDASRFIEQNGFVTTVGAAAEGVLSIPSDLGSGDPAVAGQALGSLVELLVSGKGGAGKSIQKAAQKQLTSVGKKVRAAVNKTGGKIRKALQAKPEAPSPTSAKRFKTGPTPPASALDQAPSLQVRQVAPQVRQAAPQPSLESFSNQTVRFSNSNRVSINLDGTSNFRSSTLTPEINSRQTAVSTRTFDDLTFDQQVLLVDYHRGDYWRARNFFDSEENILSGGSQLADNDLIRVADEIAKDRDAILRYAHDKLDVASQGNPRAFARERSNLAFLRGSKQRANAVLLARKLKSSSNAPVPNARANPPTTRPRTQSPTPAQRVNAPEPSRTQPARPSRASDAGRPQASSASPASRPSSGTADALTRTQIGFEFTPRGVANQFKSISRSARSAAKYLYQTTEIASATTGSRSVSSILNGVDWQKSLRNFASNIQTPVGNLGKAVTVLDTYGTAIFREIDSLGLVGSVRKVVDGKIDAFVGAKRRAAGSFLGKKALEGIEKIRQLDAVNNFEVFVDGIKNEDRDRNNRGRFSTLYQTDAERQKYDEIATKATAAWHKKVREEFEKAFLGDTVSGIRDKTVKALLDSKIEVRANVGDQFGSNVARGRYRAAAADVAFAPVQATWTVKGLPLPEFLKQSTYDVVYGPLPVEQLASNPQSVSESPVETAPLARSVQSLGESALAEWQLAIGQAVNVDLNFVVEDLPFGVLGKTVIDERDASGRALSATITVDDDGSTFGWGSHGYDLPTVI